MKRISLFLGICNTVLWNFTLFGPGSTRYLVVETNALNYGGGGLSIQDTNSLNDCSFDPAPEPLSWGLIGVGLSVLSGIARSRRAGKRG